MKRNKKGFILTKITNFIFNKKQHISLFLVTIFSIIFFNTIVLASTDIFLKTANKQEELTSEQLAEVVAKIENKWERDYEHYFDKDFINYSRSAEEIAELLSDIQKKANINPAVIWAVPQEKELQTVLITPSNQVVMENVRAADKQTLLKIIKQFDKEIVESLAKNYTSYLPPSEHLYKWIIKPFESYLEAEHIDTLLLCTGPGLRSLPFAALYDGEKFLIEKYAISRIPAFNLTDTSYKNISHDQVLAMGASEFKDQPALPGVEVELSTITPKLWSGTKILNQGFTIENLKAEHQKGKYEIVHLATHSEFNSGSPQNSYIQFSDRKLTLEDIKNLGLNQPLVDLLVLSSCETAIGDQEAEFGFAGLAIQAGVKSALASLWSISDAGTVALMSEFYQNLKSNPLKVEALRQAQIAMLKGEVYVDKDKLRGSQTTITLPPILAKNKINNLSHPFYWSGFTIIGSPW
jgi:CHAT domain-containing protein